MAHFIFLLKTIHLKECHKICFIIFGSQKQEIWFLQDCTKFGIWIKRRRKTVSRWQRDPHVRFFFPPTETKFAVDFSATARSPTKPRTPTWSQDTSEPIDPLFPTAEPPEGACRRPWWLGGGARRYAGVLRLIENALGFPTAPVNYGEAF